MYEIDHCPACHSTNIALSPAKLARFVVYHVTDIDPVTDHEIKLLACRNCSFVGSQTRLDEQEEIKLYKDYRGIIYNERRIHCEPGYTTHMNALEDYNFNFRRRIGINELVKRVKVDQIKTVLDYGGNDGRFIPESFVNAQKYVYDISGVNTATGTLLYHPDKGPRPIDFLMCCHTLEHCSDPDILLNKLRELINEHSVVYFEVPNFDFPHGHVTFHEHINVFNLQSLTALLERNAFEIIDIFQNENLCLLTKLKDD